METFFRTHDYLVEHVKAPVRRPLMDEINWQDRLIGIKGTRQVGKTTFLLQYAKERYGKNRTCLYVNLNNFYFTTHRLADFAEEFHRGGGRVLLLDQVFKYPDWSRELRECYERFPQLRIVFTCNSAMALGEDNPDLHGRVTVYNLRGFSFREFLNLKTGYRYSPRTLDEVRLSHGELAREVLRDTDPLPLFREYLRYGFYPFFLEGGEYDEKLLKTMNMMIELDVLFAKQIELSYLVRIKKLFYLLATSYGTALNISSLAKELNVSRNTVGNYMQYLYEARLINLLPSGDREPGRKPARILLHNSNLVYCINPNPDPMEVLETFLMNALIKDHSVYKGDKNSTFWVDRQLRFRLYRDMDAAQKGYKNEKNSLSVVGKASIGEKNIIPLWLLGFLY